MKTIQRFWLALALLSVHAWALPPPPTSPTPPPPPATAPAPTQPKPTQPQPPPPQPGIDAHKQLMITDLRVVEDPIRTNPANGPRAVWTFKYLMENIAGTNDPALFTMRWLQLWERDQHINGHVAPEI